MSSVDDRIVNMTFNNKQFQTGAADSTKSLETLEQTIGKMGTSAGGMTSLGSSVDGVKAKFSALQIAGVTALATIVNKAVTAGLSLLKSFTISPITDGFHEYETNLNSIQTIMANTGKSVKIVNTYLNQLNHYSDQTIYSFTQMAESIGKFTAAGVPLKESVSSIKGLANTAALSGSNVQQLNTAMYQMSQALSTGTIRLMDWNSLANAGMGGSNIREALMATNRTLDDNGEAMDAAIKAAGSFRDSLQAGWLNAETFNKTMKVMAGVTLKSGKTVAFSVDQLKQMGYAADAAKQLHKLSGAAIDSATKVKTFTQLIDVVKESIGSGWAKVFQDLFGNFNQATKMWTGVSTSITGVVSDIFSNVDKMLVGWRKLGGYQDLWTGFANIFKTIGNLVHPFVAAFQSILPATGQAGSGLAKVTQAFADITGWMVKVSDVVDRVLTPVLVAMAGVFKTIFEVGKAVVVGLSPLFALFGNLASSIGDMVSQGAQIGSSLISGLLQGLNPSAIQAAVTAFANNIVTWIKNALGIHSPAAELIPVGLSIVQGVAEGILKGIQFAAKAVASIVGAIVDGFGNLFGDMDALDWTALMNAFLTGGLLVAMIGLTKQLGTLTGGIVTALNNITSPFAEVTNTLKAMQNEIKSKIILNIAIAVGILTASLIALSLINPKKIAIGIGALSTLMGELVGSMALLSKMKPQSITAMGIAILAISTAMLTLSAAVAILGNLGLDTLAKGLGAIAVALGIMVVALKGMSGLGKGLPAAAAAIYIMSAAMSVLAIAVLAMGKMDMGTLAKGLGAIAIGMGIFVIALKSLTSVGPGVAAAAAGIYIVASAMVVMAAAIFALGKMKLSTLAKGLGTIAIGLTIMVVALGALTLLGPGVAAAAAGILLMSTAMLIMATAIGVIGSQSLSTIAKGLGAIAVGFGILLLAAAGAIAVAPGLVVLGAAVAALGLGLALAGAGMLAAATAFSILAVVGTAGIAVLVAGFEALMALLPTFALQVAASVVVFIQTIAAASPKLREAFGEIIANILGTIQDAIPHIAALANELIGAILKVVTQNIPKFGKLISTLIDTGIKVITDAVPKLANAGLTIVTGVLQGIADHLPGMIKAGTNIVIAFIKGIGAAALDIANAAAQAVLDFLEGLADAIRLYEPQIFQAGLDIAAAIAEGMVVGLKDAVGDVVDGAKNLVGNVKDTITSGFGIFSPSRVARWWGEMIVAGFVLGIRKNTVRAVGAVIAMTNSIVAAGDKVVAKAQRQAEIQAIKAANAQAKADVADKLARDAEKAAKQAPKNKALQKAANEARKAADRAQKTADAAQKAAEKAAQHVQSVQSFREADAQGKGDILTDRAKGLSERAVKMLAQANAEAQAAKKLQGKARRDLLRQARQDAKAAKDLADKSKEAKKRADDYYAKTVEARIKAIQDAREADERAQRQQERFDNATDAEKQDILQKRADREEKAARRMQKQSDALIKQAKKLAKTDAARAQRLLDRAERLAQQAKDASDKAKQDSDQAQQYADQAANAGDTSTTGANGFTLSRTALEDAAKAIDRYTKSLQEAEEAAQADRHIYQFVQNNNSPDALSELDIYRQTRNLLSAQEIKMAAPT